jgi:hypothetical protein
VSFSNGEAYIKGMFISQYENGTYNNHDETRDRKLLLHKSQINKLYGKVKTQGYTVIPTKMYMLNGKAKLEIARKIKIYENKNNSLVDKRKNSTMTIRNSVNYGNRPQQYKRIGSILKNSINSKMNDSISLRNNSYKSIETTGNYKIKNSILCDLKNIDSHLSELNSSSVNLL